MDDSGFKKIDFSKSEIRPEMSQSEASAETRRSRFTGNNGQVGNINSMTKKRGFFKFGKKGIGIAGLVIILLVLLGVYTAVNVFLIAGQAKKVYSQAKLVSAAAKTQNIVVAKEELVKTKAAAENLDKDINRIGFLRFVPLLGGYVSDASHMTRAGIHGINAGIITVDSLIPYADVLGLKGQGSFTGGSAEERIRTAIMTLDKVVPKIDDIDDEMKLAKAEMDKVNVNHYPNFWVFKNVRTKIETAKNLVDEGVLAVDEGKPLIKVLPELLGGKTAKKYLIVFQNDAELRPTGGFLTYYSIFRVDQGVIHIDSSNDIYTLDDSIASHPKADPIILKYLPKVPTQNIRDINLSPDFQKSMDDFRTYYDKSSLKTPVDGIIAIDTQFLVDIIRILGGVDAAGIHFTSEIDPACNCPQVVYKLEENTTKPVGYIRTNRKGIVGDLLYATMQKALQSSPKEYWGNLFQAAIKNANEKHVLFSLNNKDAQSGIKALGWAGEIKNFNGDYLHVNDANFGGAKSNMYIQQDIRMDYDVASSGEVVKTLTINYRNPQKYSDCNLESGGLCLNAILRDYQRVYVPKGSTLESSKGSSVKVTTGEDLNKTYFASFFTVNPLGKATMIYKYKLPFKVSGGKLPLYIQKQPGIKIIPFEIYVNGKLTEKFDLVADKLLDLKM